jgi:hypothetical protein
LRNLDKKVEINSELIHIIVLLHFTFQDANKVSLWMKTQNSNLGGFSAIQLINLGKGKKLLGFIESILEKTINEEGY